MKLLAIDGNSILNRAFYGIRPLSNTQGIYPCHFWLYEYLSEKSGRGTARCNCSGVRPAQAHVPAQGGGVL